MRPLGVLFVFLSVLVGYEGLRGRSVADVGTDIKDGTVAIVTGDVKAAREAFSRPPTFDITGTVNSAEDYRTEQSRDAFPGLQLLRRMESLGSAAKGYRWAGTGPDYYDCSGLVYKAMKELKLYYGPRFNTASFPLFAKTVITKVDGPSPGIIAVWSRFGAGHMGVMLGTTTLYSASSPKAGIGVLPIDVFNRLYGAPKFYDVKAST